MKHLSGVFLQVAEPAELVSFYCDCLGMTARAQGDYWRVGYKGQDADMILMPGGQQMPSARTGRYWKIGITLPNLDLAFDQLSKVGVPVSEPQQFEDIGYLAHLTDPQGFQVELLQWDFQGNRPAGAGDPRQPLGGDTRLGQITLRTSDVQTELNDWQAKGMRLLSVQPVPRHGFDLYFLAFTDETPPNLALDAVENREWLWKRPYTTLELQHLPDTNVTEVPAYRGLEITD